MFVVPDVAPLANPDELIGATFGDDEIQVT